MESKADRTILEFSYLIWRIFCCVGYSYAIWDEAHDSHLADADEIDEYAEQHNYVLGLLS